MKTIELLDLKDNTWLLISPYNKTVCDEIAKSSKNIKVIIIDPNWETADDAKNYDFVQYVVQNTLESLLPDEASKFERILYTLSSENEDIPKFVINCISHLDTYGIAVIELPSDTDLTFLKNIGKRIIKNFTETSEKVLIKLQNNNGKED